MARKVLISFIGTGRKSDKKQDTREYDPTTYISDNGKEYKSSFISIALQQNYNIDTTFLFGTAKSMWEEVYKSFYQFKNNNKIDDNDEYYWELANKADKSDENTEIDGYYNFREIENILGNDSKVFLLKYGLNDKENLFNLRQFISIDSFLKENDEIFLDVTHTFRSMPMIMIFALLYFKDVSKKDIKVKGIIYGMFEKDKSKIINIGIVDEVLAWIKGAYTFKSFGNAELITELLGEENEISKKLNNFSKAVEINYVSTLKQQIESFKKLKLDNLDIFSNLVIPQILQDLTDRFKKAKNDSQFQVELADWYADKHIYSSAYIVLAEALVTYVYEQEKYPDVSTLNDNEKHKKYRKEAKSKIKDYESIRQLPFNTIDKIRNKIAHASIENRESAFLNDITMLKEKIKKAKAIIYNK